MKSLISYSLLAAMAAAGVAVADTATTTPVGYVTVPITASSDSTASMPLSKTPLLEAVITAISGNVVTVSSTGAAASDFVNASPDTNSKTYLSVGSGPLAGLRFPVTANTTTTITVDGGATTLAAQGLAVGASVSVVPYWTLATLFPAGAGVGVSHDIYDPLAFLIIPDQSSIGTNRGAEKVFFYADGTDGNPAGWRDSNAPEGAVQNTYPLDPSVTYIVRAGATAQSLVVAGQVPKTTLSTKVVKAAVANDEYLSSPYPIDVTLAQSGLQSVIQASSDIYDPAEFVLIYDDAAAGFNKGASGVYFYHNGTDGNPAGWHDANNPEGPLVTAAVLKAGRSFTLRKAAGTPATLTWTAPLPYTP